MSLRPLDPRIVNVCYDANALDCADGAQEAAVARLLALAEANEIILVTPRTVLGEIEHPNTPAAVRRAALPQIFTIQTSHTTGERQTADAIRTILQGNAQAGQHDADAAHIAEADKYGGYFIAHDGRILAKRDELKLVLQPSLQIVTLAEFLDIYDHYVAEETP
jgi:hypothetical protein